MIPLSKVKIPFTKEKEKAVLNYVQFVALCAQAIMIEYQDEMVSMRFKNPNINNHSKRIVESALAIQRHLSSISINTDQEEFWYNSSLQFHRVMKHFMNYPPEKLEELMDLIDKGEVVC